MNLHVYTLIIVYVILTLFCLSNSQKSNVAEHDGLKSPCDGHWFRQMSLMCLESRVRAAAADFLSIDAAVTVALDESARLVADEMCSAEGLSPRDDMAAKQTQGQFSTSATASVSSSPARAIQEESESGNRDRGALRQAFDTVSTAARSAMQGMMRDGSSSVDASSVEESTDTVVPAFSVLRRAVASRLPTIPPGLTAGATRSAANARDAVINAGASSLALLPAVLRNASATSAASVASTAGASLGRVVAAAWPAETILAVAAFLRFLALFTVPLVLVVGLRIPAPAAFLAVAVFDLAGPAVSQMLVASVGGPAVQLGGVAGHVAGRHSLALIIFLGSMAVQHPDAALVVTGFLLMLPWSQIALALLRWPVCVVGGAVATVGRIAGLRWLVDIGLCQPSLSTDERLAVLAANQQRIEDATATLIMEVRQMRRSMARVAEPPGDVVRSLGSVDATEFPMGEMGGPLSSSIPLAKKTSLVVIEGHS
eukprot:TRINITY_DN61312_c0_g1_i1.p1 TRINITY_DN61312_c0_g1~~TRINITY_DN61312_c0_g1_i1.p1  ORF type:complete len:498 (+),score=45.59 TRINITY_DN61312_c0_g1_i1:43-1494(+)